jgi:hypothetical protein
MSEKRFFLLCRELTRAVAWDTGASPELAADKDKALDELTGYTVDWIAAHPDKARRYLRDAGVIGELRKEGA